MAGQPSNESSESVRLDLPGDIARKWKDGPLIGFEQRASLAIARWTLMIFGGVYVLSFVAAFILFTWKDATFERGSDLVKFMVQLPLPLVTLAVGYYLGDRNKQQTTRRK
jgi:hypothetical protein